MTDLATLGFKIDTAGLKAGETSLDSFGAKAKSTADAINQGTTSAKGATTATSAYAAAMGAAGSSASNATRDLGKLSEVAGVLEARAVGMASNFGIMGSLLTVLGPIGIGVAAGLGAAVVAAYELSASANRMGDFANNLSNVAQTAGITTTQLQALQIAGSQVGVSATTIEMGFNLFTVSVEQLRQGIGPLFVELEKISPSLVRQLSATHDTATAWNLLAQAYKNVDQAQRNIIARAAGGRGGIELGRVLLSTADVGGIDGQVAAMNELDLITNQNIERWKALKNAIDEESKLAKDNIASIFTTRVLENEKGFYDSFLDISRLAKDFSVSPSLSKLLDFIAGGFHALQGVGSDASQVSALGAAYRQQQDAASLSSLQGTKDFLTSKIASTQDLGILSILASELAKVNEQIAIIHKNQTDISNSPSIASAIDKMVGKPSYPVALSPDLNASTAADPSVLSAEMVKYIAALGAAATLTERNTEATLKLKAAYANSEFGVIGTTKAIDGLNRALAAADIDTAAQRQHIYVSALGQLASVSQIVAEKMAAVAKAQHDSGKLSDDQVRAIRGVITNQEEWKRLNEEAAVGVVNFGDANKAAQDQVRVWVTEGLIDPKNPTQYANAMAIAAQNVDKLREKAEAAIPDVKELNNLEFARAQLGRSAADQAAANVARQLHPAGNDYLSHLDDPAAALARSNEVLKQGLQYAADFGTTLAHSLAQGTSLAEGLSSALGNVGSSMMNSGIKDITNSLMAGGGINPASLATAGIGFALESWSAQQKKAQQAQQAFKQAQDAFAAMADQVAQFKAEMTGTGGGSLTTALLNAQQKAQGFADAAHKAGLGADDINAALAQFAGQQVADFIGSFDVMIEAMNQGLGDNSPAVKAAQNIKTIGDTLRGFIQDTQKVTGFGANGDVGGAVAAATAAAQKYTLSLLQQPPVLTNVETNMLTLRVSAQQLQSTLQELGMSADQAGQAISLGVAQALDKIKSDFVSGLQANINTAQGKGYVNDLNTLILTAISNMNDANMLGVNPAIVAQAFQAQAQAIVDGAGLIGQSFTGLIAQFPKLADVLHPATNALDSFTSSISTFLSQLQTGQLSPLSPVDKLNASRSIYQSTLAAVQHGDVTATGNITQVASNFLTAAQTYFASSPNYQQIFTQVTHDLATLPHLLGSNKTAEQLLGNMSATGGKTVDALGNVTDNTGATAQNVDQTNVTLAVLQSIQAATKSASVFTVQSVNALGQLTSDTANYQSSTYFGPMNSYLAQIAANTLTHGAPAPAPAQPPSHSSSSSTTSSILAGIALAALFFLNKGGSVPIVGGYDIGGVVGNGMWNVDSVRARYAGGGDIMLSGGEFVTRATSVNRATAPVLDYINRTGRSPSNDNSSHFNNLARVTAQGFNGQTEILAGEIRNVAARISALESAVRVESGRPARPGTGKRSAA